MNKFAHLASKQAAVKAAKMAEEIKECIYKYADEMPLALAIGFLDIVKKEIMEDHEQ